MPTTTVRRTLAVAVATVALAATGGGCAADRNAPATSASPAAATATASASAASGAGPSDSAKMICQPEAADEIAAALGVKPSQPPAATWADQVYTCRYTYSVGTMVLSIKELPDEAATTAFYTAAQNSLPSHTAILVLGQSGFVGPDGSTFGIHERIDDYCAAAFVYCTTPQAVARLDIAEALADIGRRDYEEAHPLEGLLGS